MNKKVKHLLSIFLAAFFVFIAMGSGDETEKSENASSNTEQTKTEENENTSSTSTTEQTKTEENVKEIEEFDGITISAADLFKNYTEDKKKGDSEYMGKYIKVEGVIDYINLYFPEDISITLTTNDKFGKIQCHIDKSVDANKLKQGQTITFYGKVRGFMGNVILGECKVVK